MKRSNKMKRNFTIILLLILSYRSFCQNETWTTYNTSNSGLINNNVDWIAIDHNGNKWIAATYAQGGVNVFDGTNWTSYDTSNSGLESNIVYTISIDSQNNKWFGTYHGVAKFDGTNWTSYDTSNSGLINNNVRSIALDKDGSIWFATLNGISKFDGTNWTNYTTSNSGLVNQYVYWMAIDAEGNKWFATDGGGVCKFDGTNWTSYTQRSTGASITYASSISIDKNDDKWVGTVLNNGVYEFDGTNWKNYNESNSGIAGNTEIYTFFDSTGNTWFTTNGGGVSKFNGNDWVTYDTANSGIASNHVSCMAVDTLGNKWFTCPGKGISVLSASNATVPVTLGTLAAQLKNGQILLSWTTYTELNNKGFDIERSSDGNIFTSIGFLSGNSTSTLQHTYFFTDNNPMYGKNFYRLKQIDFDNSYTYSNNIFIENISNTNTVLNVFPNPATGTINVNTKGYSGELLVTDISGHIIAVIATTGDSTAINVAGFSSGIYFLKAGNNSARFIKK